MAPLRTRSPYRPIDDLPRRYRVLPHAIDLRIPDFRAMDRFFLRTYAPAVVCSETWFAEFVDRVVGAIGTEFLPICRLGDGEYLFLLGFQPPTRRHGVSYPLHAARWLISKWRPRFGLRAGGTHAKRSLYGSGRYTVSEVAAIRDVYGQALESIARRGIIAADLSFCAVPFQDHYFPAFRAWLDRHGIELTLANYVPFYFVYAMLTGPSRRRLFDGKRVLVIHSATGSKQRAITNSLLGNGAAAVCWHEITAERSLYDVIPVDRFAGEVDVCVFGAGIGKPAVLAQLEALKVPCIDAGYVMEVWADPGVSSSRIFTCPDSVRGASVAP